MPAFMVAGVASTAGVSAYAGMALGEVNTDGSGNEDTANAAGGGVTKNESDSDTSDTDSSSPMLSQLRNMRNAWRSKSSLQRVDDCGEDTRKGAANSLSGNTNLDVDIDGLQPNEEKEEEFSPRLSLAERLRAARNVAEEQHAQRPQARAAAIMRSRRSSIASRGKR